MMHLLTSQTGGQFLLLGFEPSVSPDDGGVELSGVQVDGGEGGRGETFTETRQHGPDDLHV